MGGLVKRLLILWCFLHGSLASAEPMSMDFDVRFGGVKIGEMTVRGDETAEKYSAEGILRTTGLAGAVYNIEYRYSANGHVTGDRFLPDKFTALNRESGRVNSQIITYRSDKINSVQFWPEAQVGDDVIGQKGTLDPMTLIYVLMRPMDAQKPCGLVADLHDGKNRFRVTSTLAARSSTGGVTCDIAYTHKGKETGGLSPSGVVFEPNAKGEMVIDWFAAKTNIGILRIIRKK